MSHMTVLRDKLIAGLNLGTYSSDDVKKLAVDLAIENAHQAGWIEAIAASQGLGFAEDQPIPYTLTEKAMAELAQPPMTPPSTSIQLRPMSEFPTEGDETQIVWLSNSCCTACSGADILPVTRIRGLGWSPLPELILPTKAARVVVEDDYDDVPY